MKMNKYKLMAKLKIQMNKYKNKKIKKFLNLI